MLTGAVMFYVVWWLLRGQGRALSQPATMAALGATGLLSAVSMEASGMTTAMVIMLLGFAGGNRTLLGLGIAWLLFFISAYYYQLDATLLAKAQTLFIAGLVLLAARWVMLRIAPGQGEAEHA